MKLNSMAFSTGKSLFPIGEGGGETIAHDLLSGLFQNQIDCDAYGVVQIKNTELLNLSLIEIETNLSISYDQISISNLNKENISFPSNILYHYKIPYSVYLTTDADFVNHLDRCIRSKKYECILFQAEKSPAIFQTAMRAGVFPIFYLQNGLELRLFNQPSELPLILTNSTFYHDKIHDEHGLHSEVLYPAVCLKRYLVEENTHEFITMINPVLVKGIVPFLQMAMATPERKFLVVEGWGTSAEMVDMMRKIPNVTYMPKQVDMRKVYDKTHILVVPSQWEEAFGRVITEAQVNGIPVLASAVGGIPEAVGDGGLLVRDIQNPAAWRQGLHRVEARYEELASCARTNAQRFSVEAAVQRFMDIMESIQS